jgi:hypothetical protein
MDWAESKYAYMNGSRRAILHIFMPSVCTHSFTGGAYSLRVPASATASPLGLKVLEAWDRVWGPRRTWRCAFRQWFQETLLRTLCAPVDPASVDPVQSVVYLPLRVESTADWSVCAARPSTLAQDRAMWENAILSVWPDGVVQVHLAPWGSRLDPARRLNDEPLDIIMAVLRSLGQDNVQATQGSLFGKRVVLDSAVFHDLRREVAAMPGMTESKVDLHARGGTNTLVVGCNMSYVAIESVE